MTAPAETVSRGRRHGPGSRPTVLAAAFYLAAGAAVWWHLWSAGIGSSLASGSLDSAQDVWWLAWVPHALGHGLDPFFTTAMYHPDGVNVVSNTSFLAWDLLLAPVTVVAGPLAAFAVSVVLAPALDALVAFVVLRRFTSWHPAAFAGGLLFGFGPFAASDLRYGHLNLTVLALLPCGLALFDRVLVRRQGSPWRAGAWIGLVVVGEFFLSVELLALGVVVALVAMVLVLGSRRRRWRDGLDYTVKALGTAVGLSAAALGYPTWWYLAGPRHFSGAVWGDMSELSASLASFVQPHGELGGVAFVSGGNGDYLGPVLLLALLAGVVLWRGDQVLRFAVAMVGACAVLALGAVLHVGPRGPTVAFVAWPLLHLPVLSSAAASRFVVYADLFAALGLARLLSHLAGRAGAGPARPSGGGAGREPRRPWAVPATSALVGLCCLAPLAVVPRWPYAAHRMVEPAVLRAVARLRAGTVVREFPLASGADGDGLAWQAQAGLTYDVAGGYAIVPGTNGRATISPASDTMSLFFAAALLGRLHAPFDPGDVAGVRAHAFDDGARAVAVVLPSRGARVLGALLREALGPPSWAGPSGWLWLAGSAPELSGAGGSGGGGCCAARGASG